MIVIVIVIAMAVAIAIDSKYLWYQFLNTNDLLGH